MGAKCAFPEKQLNWSQQGSQTFSDLFSVIANEVDFPHKSAVTGRKEFINSIHAKLVERNRCNRNDYQNVAVNGASSNDSLSNLESLQRDPNTDYPVLMVFELAANDVCFPDYTTLEKMTKPELFKKNIMEMLKKINTKLPKGSHIVIWGMVQGTELQNLNARDYHPRHPLNVSYNELFDFFSCVGESPCWGWQNNNETVRNITQKHADKLTEMLREIERTTKFENFDFSVQEIPLVELKKKAISEGRSPTELLEKADGLHPSTISNQYIAQWIIETLEREHPDWLGPINKNNEIIDKLFP